MKFAVQNLMLRGTRIKNCELHNFEYEEYGGCLKTHFRVRPP